MKKNLTFESASKRLDEILQQLSDEETPLETSLKLYAEAAEMISYCSGILKNAQMKGDIQAMYIYAMLLIEENKINEGIKLLRRSARNGFDKAQNKLGFFYEYGINIKRNEKKARKYYKKSSDQGNAKGMYSYADMLEHGKGGEVNLKECFVGDKHDSWNDRISSVRITAL